MTKRYVELIEQLVRTGYAGSYNDLFTAKFNGDPTRDSFVKARDRGTNPNMATIETVARKVGLKLSYFVDRPHYDAPVDYTLYLKRGHALRRIPTVLQQFFESPTGRDLDESTREAMLEFDAAFGPIPNDVAAMAVMTAFKATKPVDGERKPDPPPRKERRKRTRRETDPTDQST